MLRLNSYASLALVDNLLKKERDEQTKSFEFTLGNYAQPEYAILQAPEMFIPGISVAIFATCTCSVTQEDDEQENR